MGPRVLQGLGIVGAGFTNTNRPRPRIRTFLNSGSNIICLDHGRRRVNVGFIHTVINQKGRWSSPDRFRIRNHVESNAVFFFKGSVNCVAGFLWITRITANQNTIGLQSLIL